MDNKEIKNFEEFLNESWDNTEHFIVTEYEDEVVSTEEETEIDNIEEVVTEEEEVATEEEIESNEVISTTENEEEIEGSLENSLRPFAEEIQKELPTSEVEVEFEVEAETETEEPKEETIGTQLSTIPEKCECKVVVLNGVVSTSNSEVSTASRIAEILKDKISAVNAVEIKLFQLNIQPVSDGEELLDGMAHIYEALNGVDILILATDIKKGQISSVLQTTIERLSNHFQEKELRNVIFGSVVAGEEDSHQNIKSSLINFANNMGMIIGGDCHVYCCAEEGKDCSHEYEADTTCAATCLKELCCATQSIRSKVETTKDSEVQPTGSLPVVSDTIKTFDEFDSNTDMPPVDNGLDKEEEAKSDVEEREIIQSDLEEEKHVVAGQMSQFAEEEEEVKTYDYENNIIYTPTEMPYKPNRDEALELTEPNVSINDCEECEEEDVCESLMDFDKFLDTNK
jgi:multimeric flavodoxin WrbA